jgi:hypothetical protein
MFAAVMLEGHACGLRKAAGLEMRQPCATGGCFGPRTAGAWRRKR